jgi:hypothetical protein
MKYRTRTIYTPEQKAQKMIKSGGIPCLRVQAGRIGSIERIFKEFTRFQGGLILLDFGYMLRP